MNRSIIILGAAAAIFSGCCNTEASRDSEALALLDRLREASANTPMMGHQADLMYGHEWRLEDDATEWTQSDVKSVCGKYPMVYGLDLAGIELGSEYNIDHNDFEQMRLSALKHYERGGIITMSLAYEQSAYRRRCVGREFKQGSGVCPERRRETRAFYGVAREGCGLSGEVQNR